MGLGDEAKNVAIEHVKQKASRDILTGIKEWRSNKISTARRRWIFELIQNAMDTAKARGKGNLDIEIYYDDKSIKFKHNGGHFTLDELSAVIYGGSTKPYAPESEYIGRFGTGFLVTHIVNRKVKIQGFACEDESQIYEFEMEVDRQSDDEKEISDNIEKCFQQLNSAKISGISNSEMYTEFEYKIEDDLGKEAVEVGIKELEENIPFILAFNGIISVIKINGMEYKISQKQQIGNSIWKININDITLYMKNDETNEVQVAVLLKDNTVQSLDKYPKIFIGMPLTETADYINIPFTINSTKFEPTRERDALTSGGTNEKLLEKALNEYEVLIKKILDTEKNITNLHNVVNIKLISKEKTKQNPLWEQFNQIIKQKFKEILARVPVVETIKEGRKPVSEVVFPISTLKGQEIDNELFDKFYSLLEQIKQNIPVKGVLSDWMNIAQNLKPINDFSDYINLYNIENLRNELVKVNFVKKQSQFFTTFDDFAKNFNLEDAEHAKQFLLQFFELSEKLYRTELISADFIDYLMPDQTGFIGPIQRDKGRIYIDDNIPEKLKDILDKIGWNVRKELVNVDFAKFEILKTYVRDTLDIDRVLDELLKRIMLKNEDVKRDEWTDNVYGWIELFWWCIENNKLLKGFPIITKDKSIRTMEDWNKEIILVPFKYMKFDEKYEEIYPDSRIMHDKYFDGFSEPEDINQKVKSLENYKCFVINLPLYEKILSINYNKLKSIATENKEISKVNHNIEAQNDNEISYLPFWEEIIGRVSEYQDRGKLLFEFIISCLLKKDGTWKKEITVKCSCGEKEHKIIPSRWLASLKTDAWLPFKITEGEKEKIEKRVASKEGIENLFSKEELEELLRTNPETSEFLMHFGFDELDLKIKLKSMETNLPEQNIRKELAKFVDLIRYVDKDKLEYIIEQNPSALMEAIDKTAERLKKEPVKSENQKIGKNLEIVIKKIVEKEGLKAEPVYKGGDLEIWPEDNEGWDIGSIEMKPYLLEIKFTSGKRAHLSKTQSDFARENKDKYLVLIVENVNNLRDELKNLNENYIPEDLINKVVENSHVIEDIHSKLGEIPNPDEIEPDIHGYWVKKKLWENKDNIKEWIRKKFGDSV